MNTNNDEDKDSHKSVPLDLARNQITTVRTVEGKTPLVMTGQSLRGMRVLTQTLPSSGIQNVSGPTIITTNIVPQAVIKQDSSRAQITNFINSGQNTASITLQKPAQITLASTPVVTQGISSGTSYHVPRGAAVVANLAAPRANITTTVRSPLIVNAQSNHASNQVTSFVRPPHTPSSSTQNTTWLGTNASHIKGASTVLSPPIRAANVATVTTKPQIIARTQATTQNVSSAVRTGTAILHSAITIGQPGQVHSFKPSHGATSVQTLNNITIAPVLTTRTQAIVYHSPTANTQYITASRLTVASTLANQKPVPTLRAAQITTNRVSAPSQTPAVSKIVSSQGALLTPVTRVLTESLSQPTVIGTTTLTKGLPSQTSISVNRLGVTPSPIQYTTGNNLGQARILHSLVAVPNNSNTRTIPATGTKVITQAASGTLHLTPITTPIKMTQANVARTISVPAAIVAQRPATVVSSQTIPIGKAFSQSSEGSSNSNVFIQHAASSNVTHRATPSPTSSVSHSQSSTLVPANSVAGYPIATGTYYYDTTVSRSFGQQSNTFTPISQPSQPVRPTSLGIITNQPMRFNPVMVVENRAKPQFSQSNESLQESSTKITQSPRPSILRKRDHEGSPLKAKNLNAALQNLSAQHSSQPPQSPPSRPDSRGNGNGSGGSTTMSATSSPGLADMNEDSMQHMPNSNVKDEEDVKPLVEMSPRKKPRKQQLTGNDLDETNDDMQFLSEGIIKKEEDSDNQSDEPRDGAPESSAPEVSSIRKPATASLLNSYRQNWKSTHNHYMRYSDVRPKDERRPTIMDLANQYRVQEKVNGWKIYHLSTQMEDLADQEETVYHQLNDLLRCTETDEHKSDRDINRINELIKGNLQRIKIINDGMIEAKSQIMKIFDHKVYVNDIINRCASKQIGRAHV